MTNPEATHITPEVSRPKEELVYETVSLVAEDRNIAFVAFEQIKGEALAQLFLKGYAAKMEVALAAQGDTERDPLQTAINDIRYVAGYYIGADEGDKRAEMLKPWNAAYHKLSQLQE